MTNAMYFTEKTHRACLLDECAQFQVKRCVKMFLHWQEMQDFFVDEIGVLVKGVSLVRKLFDVTNCYRLLVWIELVL